MGQDGTPLVCVANFAGVPWEGYRVPLPWSAGQAREWVEVLNTDAEQYGGSGVGNFGRVTAYEEPMWGQPAHAVLRLPPLGVLWLEPAGATAPPAASGAAAASREAAAAGDAQAVAPGIVGAPDGR